MNVLHFTNKPIFPILDGGRVAMHHLLVNLLDVGFSVKNVTISTPKHKFDLNAFPKDLRGIIDVEDVFINTDTNIWNALTSFLKGESYNVVRYKSKEVEDKLIQVLQENIFDLIIIESSFLLLYVDLFRKYSDAKIILRSHNVEYRIWKQSSKKEKSFLRKYYFAKLSLQLKKFELEHLNKVDGVFCISEQDKEFFRRRGVKTRMEVIPVFMELKEGYEVDYDCNDFFYLGSMNWKPNIDAVRWIVTAIVPKYKKINSEVKFHIAGSHMSKMVKAMGNKNVIFHGKVDNVFEFMSKHGTLIVPLKTGSGVRIKILEALSLGVPIISTDKGKEGINMLPKKEFLSANMTEEIVLQMRSCVDNPELKRNLGENGKLFIKKNYSKEIVSQLIRDFIKKI
jgi:polysaccharide biosynthesis protein PslH